MINSPARFKELSRCAKGEFFSFTVIFIASRGVLKFYYPTGSLLCLHGHVNLFQIIAGVGVLSITSIIAINANVG